MYWSHKYESAQQFVVFFNMNYFIYNFLSKGLNHYLETDLFSLLLKVFFNDPHSEMLLPNYGWLSEQNWKKHDPKCLLCFKRRNFYLLFAVYILYVFLVSLCPTKALTEMLP